jgi:hypothetical protein
MMRRAAIVVLALVCSALALTGAASAVPMPAAGAVTEVCRFTDTRLTEISGIALSLRHPGVAWVHNDSSGGPYVYAISLTTCRTLARVRMAGVQARDIEAIAMGRGRNNNPIMWVADIGDNIDGWPYVWLYRFQEPASLADGVVKPRVFRVTYKDMAHNAEALLVDPNSTRMWIVTKQLAHGSIYELPRPLSRTRVNVARPIHQEGGLITDGAVSPDGSRYVLRDYLDARIFRGLPVGTLQSVVPLPFQPQGEAIAWTADGRALLVASERDDRLLRVEVGP